MTTRLTVSEIDALHSDLSIEGQEFLRRMLRTDILVYEDALPEYLEWRGWEFADKQTEELRKQERDIMAGKVTLTKREDDYRDDVPELSICEECKENTRYPQEIDGRQLCTDCADDVRRWKRIQFVDDNRDDVPAVDVDETAADWLALSDELDTATGGDVLTSVRAPARPVGIPTPSPEEAWLLSVGKVAQDMADELDMVPGDMTRHYKPHVTITRPVARASEFDLEVSEWLKRDYVLSSSTAVASNGSPLLVAFLVAREFYRR